MLSELGVRAMDTLARLAAQLDLAAGLEGNLSIVASQRDDTSVLLLRLPAETIDQFSQDELDAARPRIGNGLGGIAVNADLFVLGADPPAIARFPRVVEERFKLFFFFNDR